MDKDKLTICFLANGASSHTQRWVKYFAEKGHDVHLISFVRQNNNDKNYEFHFFNNEIIKTPIRVITPIINLIPNLIRIRKLIKKIKPDIIHAHEAIGYGRLAILIGFHPLVITPWGSDVLLFPFRRGFKSKLRKLSVKLTLSKADLLTCDGDNTKQAMITLGANPQKIKIIRFGVNTEKFKSEQKNEIIRNKLFPSNSKIVISLRFGSPLHSIETLIKSIPVILKEIPEARFIIVGGEKEEGKEYLDYKNCLMDLIKSLNIAEKIKFVGIIPSNEIPCYLNLSEIYVSTCLSESGIASSTAEAMACKLPIVATDVGDNKKWIKDFENGFVIPVKDSKLLAEKITFLLKNEDIRKKIGETNRKIIEENNNYFKEMEKMEENYKLLAKNKLSR